MDAILYISTLPLSANTRPRRSNASLKQQLEGRLAGECTVSSFQVLVFQQLLADSYSEHYLGQNTNIE